MNTRTYMTFAGALLVAFVNLSTEGGKIVWLAGQTATMAAADLL
jgi:hypothetical protein